MKKIWKKIRGKDKNGESSPKSGSTRGSVSSLNVSFEIKEKELGKLHKAAWTGDLNKVKQLAKKDASPLDKENRTPLHLACVQGYKDIVKELLEWNAKPNVGDNQSKTPLMRAVEFVHEDCVELLLAYRVDVDAADLEGRTPLHVAVRSGNINIISMLLKSSASMNIKDKTGCSPLHLAIMTKQDDICRLLLREKADVNIQDINQKTPLMLACSEGSISLVQLLLEYKADVLLKDKKGWYADDYAVIQSHHACSQLIADYRRTTPASTPRSLSQPPSTLNTPRDIGAVGLPVTDAGGDDSDNETISKISGGPGGDSWADSPDASTGEEVKKPKTGGVKISLAKFASNIHISESDTDGESMPNSTPRRKISVVDNPFVEPQDAELKKVNNQENIQDLDSSWNSSLRKTNSLKGVSFKRDEELSEIHDITANDSDQELEFYGTVKVSLTKSLTKSTAVNSKQVSAGYDPTAGVLQTFSMSADKMRDSTKEAFMEELGISDVDDISEVSDGQPPPPLPSSPPPSSSLAQHKHFDDWDSSLSTPRPGILKNKSNTGETHQTKQNIIQNNHDSDDESSGWDSTESAPSKQPQIKPTFSTSITKESISEWDSDIEDMANPVYSQGIPVTSNLQEVQQSIVTDGGKMLANNKNDEDNDTTSSSQWDSEADEVPSGEANPIAYLPPAQSSPKIKRQQDESLEINDDLEEDSESMSSWEMERKKQKEIKYNQEKTSDSIIIWPGDNEEYETFVQSQINIQREEEDRRLEKEDLLFQIEEEKRADLEIERIMAEKLKEEEGERLRKQREEEERLRKQREEERLWKQREEEERLRKQREEEERLWKQREEERLRQQREEEERLRQQREEEERLRKQREEEERLRKQREEEERLRKQREEEERLRKQREEEEKIRQQRDEEKLIQNDLEERFKMQAEEEINLDRLEEENNNLEWEKYEMKRQDMLEKSWTLEEKENLESFRANNSGYLPSHQQLDLMTAVVAVDRKGPLMTSQLTSPPYKPSPGNQEKVSKPQGVPFSGSYTSSTSNTSAMEEIKHRLQVTSHISALDEEEPKTSDSFLDDRVKHSYYQGMYKPNDPLDDDALSYTSTEVEDNVYSTPSYWKDREFLANIDLNNPAAIVRVQEYARDARRLFEQEKNKSTVLENKLKIITNEKNEILKKLQNVSHEKSDLEQKNLDLDQTIRSLQLKLLDEQEQRKNAMILLNKSKEQLERKENQFSSELEAKQLSDLDKRNLQNELRLARNNMQELEKDKEELERQIKHLTIARDSLKKLNDDQQKLIIQIQHAPRESSSLESSLDSTGRLDKHNPEVYALQMEIDQQRRRFKDEIAMLAAENEELTAKNEDLQNSKKLNEDALDKSALSYNRQLTNLEKDIASAHACIERERSAKEKLEAEIESLKTRLQSSNQEMERAISGRNEMERDHKRDKEAWSYEMERKSSEIKDLKEEAQHLAKQLETTETRMNAIEHELHISNTSLTEKNSQIHQLKQDLERQAVTHQILDQNNRQEKELNAKLQSKLDTLQEKLSSQLQDSFTLKQQLEILKLNATNSQGAETQEKLSNILTSIISDNDRTKANLEEKNSNLIEKVVHLKEELKNAEIKRSSLEQELKHLQDEYNTVLQKLSQTEASLQIAVKVNEQVEHDKNNLKAEVKKLREKYQESHDKSVESQTRISELVDRLEKAESTSILSHQQLASTSANIQSLAMSKSQLGETIQQLQIENAKLEAELKYEKHRADSLYQDLQASQKVRSSLEALCANLKSTSAHLEDRLGEEIAAKVMYESQAHDHKALYDLETRSRSKLGLKIADLEKSKNSLDSKLIEEATHSRLANEKLKNVETQLEFEKEKNHKLQKDVNTLKLQVKSAKNKIKQDEGGSDPEYKEFQKDVFSKETFVSTPREQDHDTENLNDFKAELEAKYRKELNRKLGEVNKILESQSQLRDRLDYSRTDLETSLLLDKRKLEDEMTNLRVKYEQAIAQRETKEMEAKRFRELYETEMKWRLRLSDQLQFATDKSSNLQSKLHNEHHHRNKIIGSIGNLNSSVLTSNGFEFSRINGFHDDDLSNKIKAELDRSIAKHLEAAPHDFKKPMFRPVKEFDRFSSLLTQSSSDYFDILKRKYCV